MYRGLEHCRDGADGDALTLPPAAFASGTLETSAAPSRHVSLGGLSKTLGLPGLRIGWLATQDRALMARMEELRDSTTICSSAAVRGSEAPMALRCEGRILLANRERVAKNLRKVKDFVLGDGKGDDAGPTGGALEWCEPYGGTFCFPRLRQDLGPRSATEFCRFMLDEANGFGIMILPSSTFLGCPGDDRLRITYGREETGRMLERWRLGLGSSESGGNRRADRRGSLQRERFDRWHPRTSGRSFSTGASAASAGFAT